MRYDFELKGETPLLMHADIVEQSDLLKEWRKSPSNKNVSVPGDDRSPAWTWQTYLYSDGDYITMPSDNLMTSLRNAGAKINLKGKETFKKLSQSGLVILDEYCDFFAHGKQVAMTDIQKIRDKVFSEQANAVKDYGFTLFVKRAKIGQAKNVRVRARFDEWSVRGQVDVLEDAITADILGEMFQIAGDKSGLGDWRPSSKESPGPFGRFKSVVKAAK